MNKLPIVQTARNLLLADKVNSCISELNNWFTENNSEEKIWKETYNEFIVISNKHNTNSKASKLDTAPPSIIQTTKNQIVNSLLQILDDLEEQYDKANPSINNQSKKENLFFSEVEEGNENIIVETKNLDIEITINKEFENFSEKDKKSILSAIKNLLETDQDIAIKRIRKGSVKIVLELTPAQCERLHWAIQRGEFDDFDVVDSEIMEPKMVHSEPDPPYTAVEIGNETAVAETISEVASETDSIEESTDPGVFSTDFLSSPVFETGPHDDFDWEIDKRENTFAEDDSEMISRYESTFKEITEDGIKHWS